MARESFDKEIQFLRLLTLASGAYNRQQYADRLGISVHTFDKTIRKLKEIVYTAFEELSAAGSAALDDALQYQYYESNDALLLFLYRGKSLKESETARLPLILSALQQHPLTAMELLELACNDMPEGQSLPDEKTLRSDLKYLEEIGAIAKLPGTRPFSYIANTRIATELNDDELLDLYDFAGVMANTQLPSVQGYLLRDSLKQALARRGLGDSLSDPFLYKYHYYSRILDEAHLFTIAQAMEERRKLRFLYLSPKKQRSYNAKNTNPLFAREATGMAETILPLRIIYDHQYGRWYLAGHNARRGIMKFRMEGLTQIEFGAAVTDDEYTACLQKLDSALATSWVIDTGAPVKVVARFFTPEEVGYDFVKERVVSQGQWGTIIEEGAASFRYEITVNGITEIKPWLRSFGSSCEVLEPARLRREFIEEWKELSDYYESVRENIQLPDCGAHE